MRAGAKAHLQLHCCVFLWGFTSILGKLITLPAVALVWWRMLLVVATLFLFQRVRRGVRALEPRDALAYAGIGAVVTVHWVTFYGAIKLANASVAATCIAVAPVFLAAVEPLLLRRRFDARELALGVAAVPGVAMVVGGIPPGMRSGLAVGIFSALCVAVFGALNKRYVMKADPLTITCLELGSGTLVLTLWLALSLAVGRRGGPLAPVLPLPGVHDAALLIVLALVCTLLPFALSLAALRHVSAYSAQLVVNLEPVYAIGLAVLLLGEQRDLGKSFYLGVALILAVAVLHPVAVRSDAARG